MRITRWGQGNAPTESGHPFIKVRQLLCVLKLGAQRSRKVSQPVRELFAAALFSQGDGPLDVSYRLLVAVLIFCEKVSAMQAMAEVVQLISDGGAIFLHAELVIH